MRSDGSVCIKLKDWSDICYLLGAGSAHFDDRLLMMYERLRTQVLLNPDTYNEQGVLFSDNH